MPRRYWYVLLTYVLMQLSTLVFALTAHTIFHIETIHASIYWNIFSFVVGLIIIFFLLKHDVREERLSSKLSFGMLILWIFGGFWIAYFAQAFSVIIELFVLKVEVGSENTDVIVELTRLSPFFIIVPALVGPIIEEFVFRKVIFGSLYKKMNFFFAAFLSSLIFAVLHMDFSHLLIYFTMGLVFAFLYVQTKRIIVPIIVHISLNSFAVIGQLILGPEEVERLREQLFTIIFNFI